MLRPLKLAFSDMWAGFDSNHNWWLRTLSTRFEIELTDEPDLLLYSCYGQDWRRFDCTRLFVNWENRGWGFSQCDWALTSDLIEHPRHRRLPLWTAHIDHPFVQPHVDVDAVVAGHEGFASVVVSNGAGTTRNRIHELLETHRPVASGGRFRNNVGGPVQDKQSFVRAYKFHLAFENSSYPGYVTEKLLHGLQADTVPIYWGDPAVARDFNPRRFVNVHDFASDDELLARIVELDRDDAAYRSMLAEPWFPDGIVPSCADLDALLDWIGGVVDWRGTPVARRRSPLTWPLALSDQMNIRRRYRTRLG